MTEPTKAEVARRPSTTVWIDSRKAVIVRWVDGAASLVHMESDVPAHHRATGHVRHDPFARHGGAGPHGAREPHRLDHLRRFVAQVAERLEPGDDLLVLGPGAVHEHLRLEIGARDARHRPDRTVVCETAQPLTDRQLVARLRRFAGAEPKRSTGSRWRPALPSDRPSPARVGPAGATPTTGGDHRARRAGTAARRPTEAARRRR